MRRILRCRVATLEAALQADARRRDGAGAKTAHGRAQAIAESVRILLQSHAWPDGLVDLLHRMEDAAMSEEDTRLGERIAAALKATDLTAVDFVRQVVDVEATV